MAWNLPLILDLLPRQSPPRLPYIQERQPPPLLPHQLKVCTNRTRTPNADLMLGRRRKRWHNIKPTVGLHDTLK